MVGGGTVVGMVVVTHAPAETSRATEVPLDTCMPYVGSVANTSPAISLSEQIWFSVPTARPAPPRAWAALGRRLPDQVGALPWFVGWGHGEDHLPTGGDPGPGAGL